MLSSIIFVNTLSNWRATSRSAAGSSECALARSFANCRKSVASTRPCERWVCRGSGMPVGSMVSAMMSIALDHDELGAQCAGLLERFENRDEVAGRRADLVHGAHDVVEVHARVEHEHARLGLFHGDRALGHDDGVTARELVGLAHEGALGDPH